jgi:hypothetical protein
MVTNVSTKGRVVQVLGAVVDIEFPPDKLPEIYNAITVRPSGAEKDLTLEVEQHLGNNWVRCVAMGPTDGLQRGADAVDTGGPITVPVGPKTLGRIFNVLGQGVDNKPEVEDAPRLPIHRDAPSLEDQAANIEIFETGIKVFDLICPFMKGGKIGAVSHKLVRKSQPCLVACHLPWAISPTWLKKWCPARAHHLDQAWLGDLDAGRLCASRRLYRPCSGHNLRTSGLNDRAGTLDLGEGHLSRR